MKLNLLRPLPPDGQEVVAVGKVAHRGRRLAIGTSEVLHGGKLVAMLTGTTSVTAREVRRPA